METQVILTNPHLTKTEKIRQLLALGYSRREVADMTGGNYGFVQNVFARYWPERVQSRQSRTVTPAGRTAREAAREIFQFIDFNKKFGVEIEAYNVQRSVLARKLREAGIEVEVENYNHSTRPHWKLVTDGSLSGTDTFELVSPVLEGLAGLEQLKTVCRVLKQANAYINRSCGMHIHFDSSQMGIEQVKNLIVNYHTYEQLIDNFMPPSRRNNTYCASMSELARQVDDCTAIQGLINLQADRHHKVNLHSFTRYETIEFRQHSGTIKYSKIRNWVLFLHNLIEISRFERLTAPATFKTLACFQPAELITYYHNRTNELAS